MDRPAAWVAEAAGGRLVAGDPNTPGPRRAVIDSRQAGEGDLFIGLRGAYADGGEFADDALKAGAWGALITAGHADRLATGDWQQLATRTGTQAPTRIAVA